MKKLIAMVIAILLSLSMITACTNNDTENDSSNNSSVSESSNESTTSDLQEDSSVADESVDIASQVYGYFDAIFAEDNEDRYEPELAEEFSDEFSALVALGEDAFPTLDEIIDDDESSTPKRAFAKYVKYVINPEQYDVEFISPDKKYIVKTVVYSFMAEDTEYGILYSIELIDTETDSTLFTPENNYSNVSVKWSDNSRYAAITNGDIYTTVTEVIDAKEFVLIKLPDADEIKSIIQDKFDISDAYVVSKYDFTFEEWVDENQIKIGVAVFPDAIEDDAYKGSYTYDLSENKIVEESITPVEG